MQNDSSPVKASGTEGRPRGRPRAFDRSAALAQATDLFWRKDYEATSIAELTQAMGIGSPSLYAAFGSKEQLYSECLDFYVTNNADLVWAGFHSASTAREAARRYLTDSAAELGGCDAHPARGCMVTLSAVASEGHIELGKLVCQARAGTLDQLKARFAEGVKRGEIAASCDVHGLGRFVQAVQSGMAVLARDGASSEELNAVAELAMAAWDARVSG